MGKGQNLVVNQSGRERQGLPDVFVLEFRIFAFEFGAVGIGCQCLKDAADCKTEISNARFAIHPRDVDRDSVKFLHAEFSQSGLEQQIATLVPGGCATNRDFPEHTRCGPRKHQWTMARTLQTMRRIKKEEEEKEGRRACPILGTYGAGQLGGKATLQRLWI